MGGGQKEGCIDYRWRSVDRLSEGSARAELMGGTGVMNR